jgi:hypothetical protein
MDFNNNNKLKEKCEYIVRSMFMCRVVCVKGFAFHYAGRLKKSMKVGLNHQDFIMAIYLYI